MRDEGSSVREPAFTDECDIEAECRTDSSPVLRGRYPISVLPQPRINKERETELKGIGLV